MSSHNLTPSSRPLPTAAMSDIRQLIWEVESKSALTFSAKQVIELVREHAATEAQRLLLNSLIADFEQQDKDTVLLGQPLAHRRMANRVFRQIDAIFFFGLLSKTVTLVTEYHDPGDGTRGAFVHSPPTIKLYQNNIHTDGHMNAYLLYSTVMHEAVHAAFWIMAKDDQGTDFLPGWIDEKEHPKSFWEMLKILLVPMCQGTNNTWANDLKQAECATADPVDNSFRTDYYWIGHRAWDNKY